VVLVRSHIFVLGRCGIVVLGRCDIVVLVHYVIRYYTFAWEPFGISGVAPCYKLVLVHFCIVAVVHFYILVEVRFCNFVVAHSDNFVLVHFYTPALAHFGTFGEERYYTSDEERNGTVVEEQNGTFDGEQIGNSVLVHFGIAVLELSCLLENTSALERCCKIVLVLFDIFVLGRYGMIVAAPASIFAETFASYYIHENVTDRVISWNDHALCLPLC
jgi:hypothetical protein